MGQVTLNEYKMFGHKVEVVGYYNDKAPHRDYDFYDFYVDNEDDPINLGVPYYTQTGAYPTEDEVKEFLTRYLSIN